MTPVPFELLEFDGPGSHRIKINGGAFEGVIYEYGEVKFIELDEDRLKLDFETLTHETNGIDVHVPEFTQVTGDILGFLLEQHMLPESAE